MKNALRLVVAVFLLRSNSSFIRPFSSAKYSRFLNKTLIMKKDTPELKSLSQYCKPKGYNQEQYVKYLNDHKIKVLLAVGPAGTGKTMFACNTAIRELKSGTINKIVLTRPVVPVEEDIGFLPGNINKKMDPWTRPIFDTFLEFFSQKDIDLMVYNNIIEVSPLAYMRGRTFKKSFIIADEMQNSSPNQMLMLTTRIGEGSKMVITGDLKQSDKGPNSGLSDFINKYKLYEKVFKARQSSEEIYGDKYEASNFKTGIKIIEMNNTDIERSPIVVSILEIYEMDEEKAKQSLNKKNVINDAVDINAIDENSSDINKVNTNANETTSVAVDEKPSLSNSNFHSELFLSSPDFNDAALIPKSHMNKYSN